MSYPAKEGLRVGLISDSFVKISSPPPSAGSFKFGGNCFFHAAVKPNWFHRKMVLLLLGWEWVDGAMR